MDGCGIVAFDPINLKSQISHLRSQITAAPVLHQLNQEKRPCDHNIQQRHRYQNLPAQVHELIVA